MLWTPWNSYQWSADNFSDDDPFTGGTTVTASGSAHTKGGNAEILSDASVTEDVYGIAIGLRGGNANATINNTLFDLKSDPAGGTAWATIINNLLFHGGGPYWYFFPLFAKAGTAFAGSIQSSVGGGTAPGILIRVFGKPTRPELCKVGSFVRSFGPNTGTSAGASITPGNAAYGSYTASLGTTADDLWWWQGGMSFQDTTLGDGNYVIDVAAGDATNKKMCNGGMFMRVASASEGATKTPHGIHHWLPYQHIPSGSEVYMRAAASGTPDSSATCAAYGLGG